ncbi:PLP-dependent transferase [Cutaneotrichosporon oleaginosum]|uniref:PLP-dependent transferase n=1 Tax=Cutaneotrichosporon oleaginosum TaxID=879819 RepID=A0A0J0XWV1_9TREE|nr:PLP-dependent transferase [Cutaneotrichosporon oleaginosum]KLT45542.1 PLP-dependent transferase [Cutaneotrichosporon oleaginosum]TXT14504.1 hypothetical protein COLE_00697 [Cutaneotrichosporon oleaginosum]
MSDEFETIITKIRHEDDSEAHKILRSFLGNQHKHAGEKKDVTPGLQAPGATGVIYCSDRAAANGFTNNEDPEWANLGQGAPEVGDLPGGPERPKGIDFTQFGIDIHEYAPTTGVKELREAVANLYNVEYRQNSESKYTFENVCIVPGGRAGLSRVAAVIGDVYTGYQIPEYTSYSEVLGVFKRLIPVPSALKAEDNYRLNIDQLRNDIRLMSLHVIVASNPRNPTGQVIDGEELKELVRLGDGQTTIVLDEFYSWYQYNGEEGKSVSGAQYVDDVNKDSVVIIDGLTKGFRLPGWRVCWVVGPKPLISAISQSGSFLDGGANHPLQMAAIPLLDPERVKQDRLALQRAFKKKRDHVLARLAAMGLEVKVPPQATFYIWLDLEALGAPLHDGLTFFEELLKEKCIVVPGIFFDINPSHRRNLLDSPCRHFVRLSFGPRMEVLDRGLDAIERVLKNHRQSGTAGTG